MHIICQRYIEKQFLEIFSQHFAICGYSANFCDIAYKVGREISAGMIGRFAAKNGKDKQNTAIRQYGAMQLNLAIL